MIDVSQIVGAGDIARLLDTTRMTICGWRRNSGFPKPFKTVGVVDLWQWSDVLAWGIKTGRVQLHAVNGDRGELEGSYATVKLPRGRPKRDLVGSRVAEHEGQV